MNSYSVVIFVLAITIANAGFYIILISACKRQGESAFNIFRPFKIINILKLEDWEKIFLLGILVGVLF